MLALEEEEGTSGLKYLRLRRMRRFSAFFLSCHFTKGQVSIYIIAI